MPLMSPVLNSVLLIESRFYEHKSEVFNVKSECQFWFFLESWFYTGPYQGTSPVRVSQDALINGIRLNSLYYRE